MLHPGAIDIFARRDPLGKGSICRVDLFDGLRELGITGTPPLQARKNIAFILALYSSADVKKTQQKHYHFSTREVLCRTVDNKITQPRGWTILLDLGRSRHHDVF